MPRTQPRLILILILAPLAALLAACASIGRPQGGPRDERPPVFVRSTPAPGARCFAGSRIDVYFDENIKLDDAFNKLIVSPAQLQAPVASANGRHLTVELRDTLLPNTTYTIDLADAIKDLNEGNILDGFALDFSTGPDLDSLRISGIVLGARDLEPAQGILVGAYTTDADSAISTMPLERVTRTNQLGQFTLRNLREGQYYLYAIADASRDYRWDPSEDVAFLGSAVVPSVAPITVTDTLRSAAGEDSIASRPGVKYLPNDVLLTTFNEGFTAQYVKDRSRPDRRRISLRMAAPADSLPALTITSGPLAGLPSEAWAMLAANPTRDTLEYWITDPRALAADTLTVALRSRRTPAGDNSRLLWATDTVPFVYKEPKGSKKPDPAAQDSAAAPALFNVSLVSGGSQDVHRPLLIAAQQPIARVDSAGVRLSILRDTVWTPVAHPAFTPDSIAPLLRRSMAVDWEPGEKYRLEIDSAAISTIYGEHNRPVNYELRVKPLDDYVTVAFTISPAAAPMVVELLNSSDRPVAIAPAADGRARFPFMPPGDYYARLYIDTDSSGTWTTGRMDTRQQPEEVYYYPKKISLKQNWDVELDWDIYATPLDAQKPYAIKKNRPKLKAGEQAPADPDEPADEDTGLYGPASTGRGNTGRSTAGRTTTQRGSTSAGGRRLNTGIR